jgi:2'-5' RNA ligase
VPEVGPAIEAWRARTCDARSSIGVPAHITVLFPFAPARTLAKDVLADLAGLLARFEPFQYALSEARRFPEVLYLAPAPREPFVELIEAVVAAYPEYPPYGGVIPGTSIVPHLTIAQGDDELLREAESDVSPALPIASEAREVLVLEEIESHWGRWRTRARLPLGSTSADGLRVPP